MIKITYQLLASSQQSGAGSQEGERSKVLGSWYRVLQANDNTGKLA